MPEGREDLPKPDQDADPTTTATATAVDPPPLQGEGVRVAAALGLGRKLSELYLAVGDRPAGPGQAAAPAAAHPDPLDGLPALDTEEQFREQLLGVASSLYRFSVVVAELGLVMPRADVLLDHEEDLRGVPGCLAVVAVHVEIAEILGAVDPMLGAAYDLGNAITSLHEAAARDGNAVNEALSSGRIDHVRDLCNRLGSLLPPHAANAVVGALNNWEDWLAAGMISGRTIEWQQDAPVIGPRFASQTAQWYALLSGEKRADDLLGVDDYVDAGESLLREYRNLGVRFALQWWPYVLCGLAVAAGVIAAFLVWGRGDTRGIGTITTLLASLGVTAKVANSVLNRTVNSVEESIWAAELDRAIVHAATSLPAGDPTIALPVVRPLDRKAQQAAAAAASARSEAIAARKAARTG